MTATSTKIVLDLGSGTEIKEGSTISISDILSQCDLTDLATGLGAARKWATFEPDEWLLDGNYHLIPETDANIGIFSETISDVNGDFAPVPNLRIDFDTDYDLLSGITFKFSEITGDYLSEVQIAFYDSGDSLIDEEVYFPDNYEYFGALPATPLEDVRYVIILFASSNRAYRHARLIDVVFDSIVFSGSQVKRADLIEEINPVSMEQPSNTIEAELFSESGQFSIADTNSLYYQLKPRQTVYVYETIDGTEYFCGKFYLDSFENLAANSLSIKAFDAISLADLIGSLGYYYNTVTSTHRDALEVLGYLFDDAGLDYTLDSSLDAKEITGFVDALSVRETLQMMLVCIGAYASCVRSNTIDILPFELADDAAEDFTLTESDRANTRMRLLPLITKVQVKSHRFKGASEYFNAVDDTFTAGDFRIFWRANSPQALNSISGATRTTSVNKRWSTYEDINVAAPGTVVIEVERYSDHSLVHEVENSSAPAGATPNILLIDGITTAFPGTATIPNTGDEIADRLNDYYNQRYLQETRLFGRLDIKPGDRVITDFDGTEFIGIVEKMKTNLIGCISDLEIRCVLNV